MKTKMLASGSGLKAPLIPSDAAPNLCTSEETKQKDTFKPSETSLSSLHIVPTGTKSEGTKKFFENLLNYKQAAQYLGISESYLRRLKAQGKMPWVPIGNRGVRFSINSLNRWIAEREIV